MEKDELRALIVEELSNIIDDLKEMAGSGISPDVIDKIQSSLDKRLKNLRSKGTFNNDDSAQNDG